MGRDGDRFVHQSLIELALQYDPLLYAVVGFAAYHHCVQTGNGKLYTFLKYYNMALKLLRKSLASSEEHSEATLITVLVLTTFEVGFTIIVPPLSCFSPFPTLDMPLKHSLLAQEEANLEPFRNSSVTG